MESSRDQGTQDALDDLVGGPPDASHNDLYARPDWLPEKTVRNSVSDLCDTSAEGLDLSSLHETIEDSRQKLADRYDHLTDVIRPPLIDCVPEDDLKPNSTYDLRPMVCAWIYRLIAPSDGYSTVSWEDLADRLDEDDQLAAGLGFDETTPSERTLRTQ